MIHVLYISKATQTIDAQGLTAILEGARSKNQKNQLTGILLLRAGVFMQLLEGDAKSLQETLGRIRIDPRHKELQIIFETQSESRMFPQWSMGFIEKELLDSSVPNPNDASIKNTTEKDDKLKLMQLIRSFAATKGS